MNDSKTANDLENTYKVNFRFEEVKAELDLQKKEYNALLRSFNILEQEKASQHSQIESLKLALEYQDSYQINKEVDYKARIIELTKSYDQLKTEKNAQNNKFLTQISIKEGYIENLMAKLLNLHQKMEYYKDDLYKLKQVFENQKKSLESETRLREETENLYVQSLKELEDFKKSLTTMTQTFTETKQTSEETVKNLQFEYEREYKEEIEKLTKSYENTINTMKHAYTHKINTQEKAHKELMSSMMKYVQNSMETTKKHYENRIKSMIQDYSFQEAVFSSKTSNLSYLLDNLQNKYKVLEEELMGKASSLSLINEERKELIRQKTQLDKYIEKLTLDHTITLANSYAQLEETQKTLETTSTELKEQYEKKIKMIVNRKSLSVEGIKLRYEQKLEKIVKSSEEDVFKLKKFHEAQCEYLLHQLSRLESEKTEVSIRLECEVREMKEEAERVKFN